MLVTKKSIFTGVENTMELDITQEQIDRWANSGELIQNAFPWLTPEEREFLLSGATPTEWDEVFPEEDVP